MVRALGIHQNRPEKSHWFPRTLVYLVIFRVCATPAHEKEERGPQIEIAVDIMNI